jgi:RNA polymerase sigma factor (TIGR02999 family)
MSSDELTILLGELRQGRGVASSDLLPRVYGELREVAQGMMRGQRGSHTLQPTALVNEACVKLLGGTELSWQNRAHFFAVAAMAMRQVLANHARARRAAKRAAEGDRVTLSDVAGGRSSEIGVDALALDDALAKLAAVDPRQARLVELRYFAGMTMEESAFVLDVSVRTVERDWVVARAFLKSELAEQGVR